MRLGTYLLDRAVIGQGLGGSPTADRLAARTDAGPEILEIAPHEVVSMARADRSPRKPRRQVSTDTNAPLLIRIVQHPYAHTPERPRREQVFERPDTTRLELEERPHPVADCRERRDRPPTRHEALPRAAAPPRPSRYPESPK